MFSVRMRLVLLMVCMGVAELKAASIKKSINDSTVKREISAKPPKTTSVPPVPAIVAIEIVNGTENSPSVSKTTSKRTIESSLGYGYGPPLNAQPQKQFVIYKYSQQDIPPASIGQFNGEYNGHGNIQNNGAYFQPQQTAYEAPSPHGYNSANSATTLYTTFSNQGHLGGLSNSIPYQNVGHSGMVPVIILRVYANQLTSPDTALHTNLPQSHPYSSLNNINLQSLLQNYVQQYLHSQQQASQHYQMPDYQQLYQSQQQAYQVPEEYHSNLPTSENYPSKLHTRVIFHSNNNGHLPEPEPPKTMLKTAGLSTYQTVPLSSYKPSPTGYVDVQTPDSQYAYSSGVQHADQPYMYVYPSQADQDIYYQDTSAPQHYQVSAGNDQLAGQVAPTASQDSHVTPYNYHAHPREAAGKQKRSKKNIAGVSSTLSPKRRVPRTKAT